MHLLSQVQGFDKTVCAVGEKGEKRRLNCEYMQCNKQTQGALSYTYKTNGRNHILEYEKNKDAAALKFACCLIRHNRCRVFIHSTVYIMITPILYFEGGGLMFCLLKNYKAIQPITMPKMWEHQKAL